MSAIYYLIDSWSPCEHSEKSQKEESWLVEVSMWLCESLNNSLPSCVTGNRNSVQFCQQRLKMVFSANGYSVSLSGVLSLQDQWESNPTPQKKPCQFSVCLRL